MAKKDSVIILTESFFYFVFVFFLAHFLEGLAKKIGFYSCFKNIKIAIIKINLNNYDLKDAFFASNIIWMLFILK